MDEVIIKGAKYLSSKRAALLTGYAKDYIGQLVRMGKLPAVKVGRSWFVSEHEIKALSGVNMLNSSNTASSLAVHPAAGDLRNMPSARNVMSFGSSVASVEFPKTWATVKYYQDSNPLLPAISDSRDMPDNNDKLSVADSAVRIRVLDGRNAAIAQPSAVGFDGVRVVIRENGSSMSSINRNESVSVVVEPRTYSSVRRSPTSEISRVVAAAILVSLAAFLMPILG